MRRLELLLKRILQGIVLIDQAAVNLFNRVLQVILSLRGKSIIVRRVDLIHEGADSTDLSVFQLYRKTKNKHPQDEGAGRGTDQT